MKTILSISILFCLSGSLYAQYNPTTSMQADFKSMASSGKGRVATGFEGLATYSSGEIKGSQFFYPDWAPGSVTTKDNETMTLNYLFVYDRVRQEVFIVDTTDKGKQPLVLQAEKSQVKSFTLKTDKEHIFVPAGDYLPDNTSDFLEVLQKNESGYTLLKLVNTSLVKANMDDVERVKRGDIYDAFVNKTTYYISVKSGKAIPFNLKQKTIVNLFGADKKNIAQTYFSDHGQDEVDDKFLTGLFEEVNR